MTDSLEAKRDAEFMGKSVLVTGAGSGLGRATALAFARAGADLCLLDNDANGLHTTADSVKALYARCNPVVADVSEPPACVNAVRIATDSFGGLDVLCNVAGILLIRPLASISADQWQRVISVNLSGPFFLCQAAMPHLIARQGAIVNVCSSSAFMGHAYMAPYTVSKAGLVSLTKSLAMEFIKEPVRINGIAPGGMDTAMTQNIDFPEGLDMSLVSRYVPLRGNNSPEDVTGLILYLASSRAKAVHGSVYNVDSGLTAG
jgi:meso-butanediol dehydrogenase/(S,S)-butanediol dehydrogenase/diacetyl reductase